MKKHLENFAKPYQKSRIPFFLAEIITDGTGEMVDLVFRFVNTPAAVLFDSTVELMQDRRFTRIFPPERLRSFLALADVAFRGSAASFEYRSLLGRQITISCYQPTYGVASCILEEREPLSTGKTPPRYVAPFLAENLPCGTAVLEDGPQGLLNHSFNSRLCELSGYSRKELLTQFSGDFSPLFHADDWSGLLQSLRDSARDKLPVNRDVRLVRKDGIPLWVNLRAKPISVEERSAVFYTMLMDIDARRQAQDRTEASLRELSDLRFQFNQLFNCLPGEFCLLKAAPGCQHAELLRASRGLAELLGYSPEEFGRLFASVPLAEFYPDDQESLRHVLSSFSGANAELQSSFRVRQKNGAYLRLLMQARKQVQNDGSILIYASFCGVIREKPSAAP